MNFDYSFNALSTASAPAAAPAPKTASPAKCFGRLFSYLPCYCNRGFIREWLVMEKRDAYLFVLVMGRMGWVLRIALVLLAQLEL
jgi:hypothetical protein